MRLSAQSAVPCLFLFLYCGYRASLSRPEATPAVSVRVLFASEELSARAIETQREQLGAECSWVMLKEREAVNSFTAENCSQRGTKICSLPGSESVT